MFFARVWANGHPMGNSWLELSSRSAFSSPTPYVPPVSTGGNVYAISLYVRVYVQMQVQMHVYVLFTFIGRNERRNE